MTKKKDRTEPESDTSEEVTLTASRSVVAFALCDTRRSMPYIAGDTRRFYIYAKPADAKKAAQKGDKIVTVRITTFE